MCDSFVTCKSSGSDSRNDFRVLFYRLGKIIRTRIPMLSGSSSICPLAEIPIHGDEAAHLAGCVAPAHSGEGILAEMTYPGDLRRFEILAVEQQHAMPHVLSGDGAIRRPIVSKEGVARVWIHAELIGLLMFIEFCFESVGMGR
jgi:hypothetical protein